MRYILLLCFLLFTLYAYAQSMKGFDLRNTSIAVDEIGERGKEIFEYLVVN